MPSQPAEDGQSIQPRSRYFEARRLRLHYVDWGNETAPALILVHGGLDHCRSWDWLARAHVQDFHVVALDLAGHGDSAHAVGGCYALTDFVFDLSELYRELGLSRACLIGHSMGGGICSIFAGAFPERVERLVLIEGLRPAMLSPEPAEQRIRSWVEMTRGLSRRSPRAYPSLDAAVVRMRAANPSLSDDQAAHLTQYALNRGEDGFWRWKYDNFIRSRSPSRLPRQEIEALWRNIEAPTLLIGGSESGRPDPSRNGWLSLFKNGRSIILPGAGHWVHHDRLADVVDLTRSFLGEELEAVLDQTDGA